MSQHFNSDRFAPRSKKPFNRFFFVCILAYTSNYIFVYFHRSVDVYMYTSHIVCLYIYLCKLKKALCLRKFLQLRTRPEELKQRNETHQVILTCSRSFQIPFSKEKELFLPVPSGRAGLVEKRDFSPSWTK